MASRSQYDPTQSIAFYQSRLDNYLPPIADRFDYYQTLLLPSEKERNLLHEDAKRRQERADRIEAEEGRLDAMTLELSQSVRQLKDELDRWLQEAATSRTAIGGLSNAKQPAGKRDVTYLIGDKRRYTERQASHSLAIAGQSINISRLSILS